MKIKGRVYAKKAKNGTYYARIILPNELRAVSGKSALWRSTGSGQVQEAKRSIAAFSAAAQLIFQELADKYLDGSEVSISAEFNRKTVFNVTPHLDAIDQEAIEHARKSLEKSLTADSAGERKA